MRLSLLCLAAALVAVACADFETPAPPPPDLQTRPSLGATNPDEPPTSPDLTNSELPTDAGHVLYDAGGCCVVDFALRAGPDERRADLTLYPSMQQFGMTQTQDGGVWSVSACVPLRKGYYYFAMGLQSSEPDGGLFPTTRVSPMVPSEPNAVVDQLNVFDPGTAETCGALDAGIYAALPDAG